MQRLAKIISNAGICSRRDAEKFIKIGKVEVDGIVVNSPATLVGKNNDIKLSGKLVKQEQVPRLWLYYKPLGLITTHKDTHARDTIFKNLANLPRVISVGRLDLNSEGLLLLTNNGDLARTLELPSSKIERTYKVRAYGKPESLLCANYQNIIINGIYYNPKSIRLTKVGTTNFWFEVILTEGKNREIRKIYDYFGLTVNRLIRVQYGRFVLGNLKPGEYRELSLLQFQDFLPC